MDGRNNKLKGKAKRIDNPDQTALSFILGPFADAYPQ